MRKIITAIILLIVTSAYAFDEKPLIQYLLVTYSSNNEGYKTFQMKANACLRGPLSFFDKNGKVIFDLKENVEYPTDCSTKN